MPGLQEIRQVADELRERVAQAVMAGDAAIRAVAESARDVATDAAASTLEGVAQLSKAVDDAMDNDAVQRHTGDAVDHLAQHIGHRAAAWLAEEEPGPEARAHGVQAIRHAAHAAIAAGAPRLAEAAAAGARRLRGEGAQNAIELPVSPDERRAI